MLGMMMHATGAVYVRPCCREEGVERKGRERKDGEWGDKGKDREVVTRPHAFLFYVFI